MARERSDKRKRRPSLHVRDPAMLQIRFYKGYDPDLLFNRARAVSFAIDSGRAFSEYWETHPQWPADIGELDIRALASDLHFLEVHQSEVMLAMLCAPFQPLPHWVYLTTYSNSELATKAEACADGNWGRLTADRIHSGREFVETAIYNGVRSNSSPEPDVWKENCENLIWLLQRIARRHIDNRADNNAYKHGLRVLSEHNVSLAVALDHAPEEARTVYSYAHGLAFLEVNKDRGEVSLLTKEINPLLSLNYLFIMRQIVATCRDTRLAALEGRDGCNLNMFTRIDRNGIMRATPGTRFSFTV